MNSFRADIQGMRAVAVLSVLAYHIWPGVLPGGYVGVDVFFVISGFLITGLLVREFERSGTISLRDFYARRIRRLLPAASLTLLAVAVSAWFWSSASEWRVLAKELVASALYVENWLLVERSVDYLAQDAAPSPVQHFWSLSVEEQFYIFWPLLMLGAGALARTRKLPVRKVFLTALLSVTLISLGYGIYVSFVDPAPGYFLTTTRIWELGVGGLLAIASRPDGGMPGGWVRTFFGWTGMAAIMLACWFYSSRLPFPGYEAMLPTLGAVALLYARPGEEGLLGRLLGSRPMQYFGDISYSLYLWHWPIVVFYPLVTGREVATFQDGMAVAVVSVIAAHLSKQLVEERFRHGRKGESLRPYMIGAGLTATLALSAGTLLAAGDREGQHGEAAVGGSSASAHVMKDPMAARNDLAEAYSQGCIASSRDEDVRVCRYGKTSGTTVVAVGDSHMVQWLPALAGMADQKGFDLHAITKTGCAYMSILEEEMDTIEKKSCAVWNAKVSRVLDEIQPDVVIFANSMGASHMLGSSPDRTEKVAARMAEAWAGLRASQSPRLIAIRETPRMREAPPSCLMREKATPGFCDTPRWAAIGKDSLVTLAAAKVGDVSVIDMNDAICGAESCSTSIDDVYVWRDQHHMTASFVRTLTDDLSRRVWPQMSGKQ